MESRLSADEVMCAYCFDVLLSHFNGNSPPLPPFDQTLQCPMFVTLNSLTRSGKSLRGCIGTLTPRPLAYLSEYTNSSAFRDHRFEPLRESEIDNLEICVSLLVNYETVDYYLDWEVGVHGILIEFAYNRQKYSATYLPEVASEQKWSQEQAIQSLIRKAGYQGSITAVLYQTVRLTRYLSSKAKLSYELYKQLYSNNLK